jgi:hypothetical protein
VYGAYNSNTLQVNFLHDALVTYEITAVDGKVVRQVAANGDTMRLDSQVREERDHADHRSRPTPS